MLNLIEDILLSDLLIVMVLLGLLIAVSRWALSTREYPAYALGWLIGIFFIVIYRSLSGDNSADIQDTAETTETTLTFFGAVIPGIMGILAGIGIMFIIRRYAQETGTGKSIGVAISTSILIIILFLLATAGETTRQLVSILALGFAIGALSAYVLKLGSIRPRPPASRFATQNIPAAQITDETRDRFEQHRRRFDDSNN